MTDQNRISPAAERKRKRPFGVIVITALTAVRVLVLLLVLIELPAEGPPLALRRTQAITGYYLLAVLLLPVEILLAFGLFYLKRWAWVLYMIRLGVNMGLGLLLHFRGAPDVNYLFMLLDVISVFYLNQRDVQRAFGHGVRVDAEEALP